eukprot:scaffold8745_cov113-Isochrysis_galbana.AAC.5
MGHPGATPQLGWGACERSRIRAAVLGTAHRDGAPTCTCRHARGRVDVEPQEAGLGAEILAFDGHKDTRAHDVGVHVLPAHPAMMHASLHDPRARPALHCCWYRAGVSHGTFKPKGQKQNAKGQQQNAKGQQQNAKGKKNAKRRRGAAQAPS